MADADKRILISKSIEEKNKEKDYEEYILKREGISFLEFEKTKDFYDALKKYPHLKAYVEDISTKLGEPEWYVELDMKLKQREIYNIIYPVGDPIFINIRKIEGEDPLYFVIEPELNSDEKNKLDKIQEKIAEYAIEDVDENFDDLRKVLYSLFDRVTVIGRKNGLFDNRIVLKNRDEYELLRYYLIRERLGLGKLEPLIRDPYIEDIHVLGVGKVYIVHKIFGMLKTNLEFKDDLELDKYMIKYSELINRPVSEARPITDAILPDGSRVNFIFGRDISLHGSSFTIRKFNRIPLSVTQLIDFGTMTPEEAAYLWVAIENGMNIFIVGETASGKTTFLNAISTFIRPDWKVYTVEDTPELNLPHPIWQRLVTREIGKSTDVQMYDLLRAALRSRPNYIIVGEIRGKEASVAFQAMQTGHPVLSTFHAGSVVQVIERLTGDPINVPIQFMDNLNIVVIVGTILVNGRLERRVLSIDEIERYIPEMKRIAFREVFAFDRIKDKGIFKGKYNSYLMERKIAPLYRFNDRKKIYELIDLRARILSRMVEEGIFNFYEVWEEIKNYYEYGLAGLSFNL